MAPQVPLPQQGGPPSPSSPPSAPSRLPRPPNPEDAKLQLATRRLQGGESLAELADDLLHLTRLAYPRMDPASQDELARDRLLVEVEDHAARKRARLSCPPTVAAALRAISSTTSPSTPTNATSTTATSTSPSSTNERGCCSCADGTAATDMKALAEAVRENTETMRQFMEKLKAAEPEPAAPTRGGWRFF